MRSVPQATRTLVRQSAAGPMNQMRETHHSIRPHHSPERQPEGVPASSSSRVVATTALLHLQ
jgi:hypothetical protein